MVIMKCEDSEPWMCSMIMKHGEPSHSSQSYNIRVTKTGYIITSNLRQVKMMPKTAEQQLQDHLAKQWQHKV